MVHTTAFHNRAGKYVSQPTGYKAFIPDALPPDPGLQIDGELLSLLSEADQNLGRLDGSTGILPNPDLFVRMYQRKEAVLSSQIEGTQASLVDVLEYEAEVDRPDIPSDASEVFNYTKALDVGLKRLHELPLCNRLFREIHQTLLADVRGQEKTPGEFRRSQNWIGAPGCDLRTATYVPPPPHEMNQAMGDLERFIHEDANIPILLKCGLVHGQFEMIHPFLDGNGRLGRLIITLLLCEQNVLTRPLLYLSEFFMQHRDEYYNRLNAVHEFGDWEGWIKFFLRGVRDVSLEATETASKIIALREEHRQLVNDQVRGNNGLALLDHLYQSPVVLVHSVESRFNVSYVTANNMIRDFTSLGLLEEITNRPRNRVFLYRPYIDILVRNERG